MKLPRLPLFAAATGTAIFASLASLHAADTVYTFSGTSGNWNVAGTWAGGLIPPASSPGDVALATASATPITLNTAATLGAIKVTSAAGTTLGIANSGAIAFTMDGTGMSAANNGFGNAGTASILNGTNGGNLNLRPNLILTNTNLDIGYAGASGGTTMSIGVTTANSTSITNADNVDRALNFRLNSSSGSVTIYHTIGSNGSLGGGGTGTGLINISNLGTNGTGTVSLLGNLTTGVGSVTQNSANSRMALSGTNTYDGAYTITSGALSFINRVSLFNADNTKWTASKIAVGASGTLGLGYGSAGNFTAAEIAAINASDILVAGSRLGIDVSTGTATYSNVISNSNGGANVTGFAKLGAGTLTVDATNTYGGITNLTAGTLILGTGQGATTGALGNTSAIVFNGGILQFSAANTFDYSSKFNTTGNAVNVNTGGQTVTFASNLTNGSGASVTKGGTGTLIMSGNSTYGVAGTIGTQVNSGTLRGVDSTVRTGNANLNKFFGAGAVQLSGGAILDLRANGTNDASAQTLTLGNQLQVSSTGVTYTVNVDRDAATGGTGKTIALGNHNTGANNTLNITGDNGFKLGISTLALGGGATASVVTLNPTTASVVIASVGGGTNSVSPNLKLDGTSTGNSITGVIANNATAGPTGTSLTKSNTSTWTLNGINTYTGATTVSGGTLVVTGSINSTTAVNITGGTFSAGASNIINNAAGINLGGGVLQMNGFSEALGVLAVTGSTELALGGGQSAISFADSSGATWTSAALSITGWDGLALGGGTEQVTFGTPAGLSAGQLAAVTFVNPFGFAAGIYSAKFVGNELVPDALIPEPSTALLLMGGAGLMVRRRRK